MGRPINLGNLDESLGKFWVPSSAVAPTAAGDIVVAEAGALKGFQVRGVIILNPGLQTGAAVVELLLLRKTTAGNNNPVVPNPLDPSDTAFSGICRALPGAPGTDGAVLARIPIFVPAAAGAFQPVWIDLGQVLGSYARIPAGTANGVALKHPGAAGAAGFHAALLIQE